MIGRKISLRTFSDSTAKSISVEELFSNEFEKLGQRKLFLTLIYARGTIQHSYGNAYISMQQRISVSAYEVTLPHSCALSFHSLKDIGLVYVSVLPTMAPECLVYTHALVGLFIQVATLKVNTICEHSDSAAFCLMIMNGQIPLS